MVVRHGLRRDTPPGLGLDLNAGGSCNADTGLAVVAPLAGIVRATCVWDGYTAGEGNHVWLELDDACLPGVTWFHVDHLLDIVCTEGQRLAPGGPVGLAGRSGNWECTHAHCEWLTGPPRDGWYQWPYGWSQAQVEAAYWNPWTWWGAASAKVLAGGGQPIPPEVVEVLDDWQIKHWIMPDLWQWAGLDYNPDAGTSQGWVDALRAGNYLGRPRTGERPYGEGGDVGVWMEFESGVLLYRLRDGQASWTG